MFNQTEDTLTYKDENIVVLYSGGEGSTLAAYLLKKAGYKNVTLLFTDTKSEDEDCYRWLRETSAFLNYPLIENSDGRDIWQVFKDSKFMGNSRVDPCSRILKRERTRSFLKNLTIEETKTVQLCFGIDLFESERLEAICKNYAPLKVIAPLVDLGLDRSEVLASFLEESKIKRARAYSLGFAHNNCGFFCVKAGLSHYKNLYEKFPERYLELEEKEADVYSCVPNARPFLRKKIKGVTHYLTLKQYREEYLEKSVQLDPEEDYLQSCIACSIL